VLLETLTLGFMFRSKIQLKLLFVYGVRCRDEGSFLLPYGYPIAGAPFVKTAFLSLSSWLGTLIEHSSIMYMWIYFRNLYFSILTPIPHCIHYCSLIVSLEIRYVNTPDFGDSSVLDFLPLCIHFRINRNFFFSRRGCSDFDCMDSRGWFGDNGFLNNTETSNT